MHVGARIQIVKSMAEGIAGKACLPRSYGDT
jgi:hypothetical protein